MKQESLEQKAEEKTKDIPKKEEFKKELSELQSGIPENKDDYIILTVILQEENKNTQD